MKQAHLQHLIFVFPELLLVLFALTLVLGRYSGYRLTELFRFRALAREGEGPVARRRRPRRHRPTQPAEPKPRSRRPCSACSASPGACAQIGLMGIGQRNADYVLMLQPAQVLSARRRQADHQEARDRAAGLPVPELYAVVREEHEIDELHEKLKAASSSWSSPRTARVATASWSSPAAAATSTAAPTASFMTREEFDHHLSNMLSGLF